MEQKKSKSKKYKEEIITADYILRLYTDCKSISNKKSQKAFLQDVKKLIPYIGQSVILEIEDEV